MKFIDISRDKQKIYTLKENEKAVFFFLNRSGDMTFELRGDRAEAHIIALFDLAHDTTLESQITQIHRGEDTISSFTGRSILRESARCSWHGLLSIEPSAPRSDAHQEMKHLLLSPDAEARSLPALEIEQDDVRCGHAATMSAPDPEQIFFLCSRGLSEAQAIGLVAQGFLQGVLQKIETLVGKEKTTELRKSLPLFFQI